MKTVEELEALALAEYETHKGLVLSVSAASVCRDSNDEGYFRLFNPPAKFRLIGYSFDEAFDGEWFVPRWFFEPLGTFLHSTIGSAGVIWAYSTHYHIDGRKKEGEVQV